MELPVTIVRNAAETKYLLKFTSRMPALSAQVTGDSAT
jgi:hypothetical protein